MSLEDFNLLDDDVFNTEPAAMYQGWQEDYPSQEELMSGGQGFSFAGEPYFPPVDPQFCLPSQNESPVGFSTHEAEDGSDPERPSKKPRGTGKFKADVDTQLLRNTQILPHTPGKRPDPNFATFYPPSNFGFNQSVYNDAAGLPTDLPTSLNIGHPANAFSPAAPSSQFPFENLKYPTFENLTVHLSHENVQPIYENILTVVELSAIDRFGKPPLVTLIDSAVYYLKTLNWDHPLQRNMLWLAPMLHNSQHTNLHQWLWEAFTVAVMLLKKYAGHDDITGPLQQIKQHIARFTNTLLCNDMAEYQNRQRAVFGGALAPAAWTKQCAYDESGWKVLGLENVINDPTQWDLKFLEKLMRQFNAAGVNPLGLFQAQQAEW